MISLYESFLLRNSALALLMFFLVPSVQAEQKKSGSSLQMIEESVKFFEHTMNAINTSNRLIYADKIAHAYDDPQHPPGDCLNDTIRLMKFAENCAQNVNVDVLNKLYSGWGETFQSKVMTQFQIFNQLKQEIEDLDAPESKLKHTFDGSAALRYTFQRQRKSHLLELNWRAWWRQSEEKIRSVVKKELSRELRLSEQSLIEAEWLPEGERILEYIAYQPSKAIERVEGLSKQIDVDPENIDLLMQRSEILLHVGDIKRSQLDSRSIIRILDSRLKDSSRDIQALLLRAIIFAELEMYEKSYQDIDLAIKLDSDNPACYVTRYQVDEKLLYLETAIVDLSKAIQLDNKNTSLLLLRSSLYLQTGNVQKADDDTERYQELKQATVILE